MEATGLFRSPPFDFSSNTRYVQGEGRTRSEYSSNNELRPLFLPFELRPLFLFSSPFSVLPFELRPLFLPFCPLFLPPFSAPFFCLNV